MVNRLNVCAPFPSLCFIVRGAYSYFQDRHAIVDGDAESALADENIVTVEGELTVSSRAGRVVCWGRHAEEPMKTLPAPGALEWFGAACPLALQVVPPVLSF